MNSIAKTVDMIACFDKEGKINPFKFRYEEEDETKVVCVNKVLKREYKKLAGIPMMEFTCSSVIDGVEKRYIVKYDALNFKWIVF